MCVFDMCAFCSQRVQNRTVCAWLRRATIFVSPQSLSQVKQAAERPFTLLYIQRTGGGGGEGKTIKYYIKKILWRCYKSKNVAGAAGGGSMYCVTLGGKQEEECLPVKGGQLLSPGCLHFNTATKEMTTHCTD